MWSGRPSLRAVIVAVSAVAWLLNFIAPLIGLPSDPGLGVAFFGVIGAVIAIPYAEQEKKRFEAWDGERRKERAAEEAMRRKLRAEWEAEQRAGQRREAGTPAALPQDTAEEGEGSA